jgi:hypothetical protein
VKYGLAGLIHDEDYRQASLPKIHLAGRSSSDDRAGDVAERNDRVDGRDILNVNDNGRSEFEDLFT